ncbi:hypothetical protein [Brasilonema octagenarum]|jgi:hypothetical protein|nr:hypothetical protein [Brasilonema octagenarum]
MVKVIPWLIPNLAAEPAGSSNTWFTIFQSIVYPYRIAFEISLE